MRRTERQHQQLHADGVGRRQCFRAGNLTNPTVSTLNMQLTVATQGNYTVTFADDQFPVALPVERRVPAIPT